MHQELKQELKKSLKQESEPETKQESEPEPKQESELEPKQESELERGQRSKQEPKWDFRIGLCYGIIYGEDNILDRLKFFVNYHRALGIGRVFAWTHPLLDVSFFETEGLELNS